MFKPFLYFLTDKDGNSYRVNNGVVGKTATPTPLTNTPDGWQEKSIKYGRSNKYFALFRTFTTPLKFVADSAKILRDQFYKLGSEAEMFLIITRLNNEWIHKQFYKGELDFTQCEDSEFQVTANVMEGELSKLFKAGEDTVYELPLDGGRQIKMDGLVLKQQLAFLVYTGPIVRGTGTGTHYLPMIKIERDQYSNVALYAPGQTVSDLDQSQQAFIENQAISPITINITGSVSFSHNNFALGGILGYWIFDSNHNQVAQQTIYSSLNIPGPNYTAPIALNITLQPGQKIAFTMTVAAVGPGASQAAVNLIESEIGVKFDYRAAATTIKALDPITVGQMLVDKMTGGGYEFRSNYLASEWGSLLITSGDGVRGLEGAVVKTSFASFFNSYNVVSPLAMGIEGKTIWIEERAKAWPSTAQPLDLGAVSDLKVKPASDHLFNTIKIGYPDNKLDDVNGRNEFNTTHVYSAPVSRSVRELNLVSTYKAGMYDIEFTRVNLEGKKTTNSSTDNDVFFLHTEKYPQADGVYKLLRLNYSPVSGLLDKDSAFNIELSPKRCLKRHGAYLRGSFYYQPMGVLKFESGDRNVDMVTGTVSERADFPINAMGDPLFVPLEFTFECPVPEDMIEQIEAMPQRPVLFTWNGTVFVAYPTDISIQPASNATQSVSALCAVGNDLTKLII